MTKTTTDLHLNMEKDHSDIPTSTINIPTHNIQIQQKITTQNSNTTEK